jgi:hypothetical protein
VSGRRMLTARVSEVGVREVDKVADREGLARSEAIRLLLAFAVRRMPKGWRGGPATGRPLRPWPLRCGDDGRPSNVGGGSDEYQRPVAGTPRSD